MLIAYVIVNHCLEIKPRSLEPGSNLCLATSDLHGTVPCVPFLPCLFHIIICSKCYVIFHIYLVYAELITVFKTKSAESGKLPLEVNENILTTKLNI